MCQLPPRRGKADGLAFPRRPLPCCRSYGTPRSRSLPPPRPPDSARPNPYRPPLPLPLPPKPTAPPSPAAPPTSHHCARCAPGRPGSLCRFLTTACPHRRLPPLLSLSSTSASTGKSMNDSFVPVRGPSEGALASSACHLLARKCSSPPLLFITLVFMFSTTFCKIMNLQPKHATFFCSIFQCFLVRHN